MTEALFRFPVGMLHLSVPKVDSVPGHMAMAAWKPWAWGGGSFSSAMASEEMLGMTPKERLGSGEVILTAGSFKNSH